MSLANVEEKLGDWDSAYNSWNSLYKLAKASNVREVAQASLVRVNDERIINRLVQAEKVAKSEEYVEALRQLRDAVTLKPSPRTFDRIRSRYFEFIGQWFNKEIKAAKRTHGWKSIAVANFAGDLEIEGYSIRDRIYSTVAANGRDITKMIYLSEKGITAIQKAALNQIPEQDKQQIDKAGVEAVVFGTIGGQLSGYVYDVVAKQTQPILTASLLNSIPGFPTNVEAWMLLPSKNSTNQGLRVEVWTEKSSYRIEDEVTFYIRSNRDCFITLLDLQTSGGLYVLFPNALQKENKVTANRIYSIPAAESSFTINATGPRGIEGVKAIATTKSISAVRFTGSETFIAARTAEHQKELCLNIQSILGEMGEEEWDIAEWTFEIGRN